VIMFSMQQKVGHVGTISGEMLNMSVGCYELRYDLPRFASTWRYTRLSLITAVYVTPCSVVDLYLRFGETFGLDQPSRYAKCYLYPVHKMNA
jgi:hypothetical protein